MTDSAQSRLRDALKTALDETGTTQVELANTLGVTQKHISQVLSGKSGLSLDLAERALAVLGRRLHLRAVAAVELDGRREWVPAPPGWSGGCGPHCIDGYCCDTAESALRCSP